MKKFGCNTWALQSSGSFADEHRSVKHWAGGGPQCHFTPFCAFPLASSPIPRGPTSTTTLDGDVPSKFLRTRGRIEKSMGRKAGEQRCKAHLCCRPARKTLKNAVMTHCPRIARDNYTPLRPTRYSLFFRSRPRTEARCGRSRYAKACASARRFIVDYSVSILCNPSREKRTSLPRLQRHCCEIFPGLASVNSE